MWAQQLQETQIGKEISSVWVSTHGGSRFLTLSWMIGTFKDDPKSVVPLWYLEVYSAYPTS